MGKLHTPVCGLGNESLTQGWRGQLSQCLLKSKTSGGKQRRNFRACGMETSGAVQAPSSRATAGSWWVLRRQRDSPLAPAHCSLPKLVKMSHSECKQVVLMEPTEVSLLKRAVQRNSGTSDRWNKPEADKDVSGGNEEGSEEPSLQLTTSRHLVTFTRKASTKCTALSFLIWLRVWNALLNVYVEFKSSCFFDIISHIFTQGHLIWKLAIVYSNLWEKKQISC